MAENLGYDLNGNNRGLLAEVDRLAIDNGNYQRVGTYAICQKCSCPYNIHPPVQGALWLNRGCDGLVKL